MRILDSKASGFEEEVLGFKQRAGEVDKKTVKVVEKILGRIRAEGDPALFELTRKFDRVTLDRTNVEEESEELWGKLEDIKLIEKDTLELLISKNYYDFSTASWIKLQMIGIYARVEN